jgi:hypothetical protein
MSSTHQLTFELHDSMIQDRRRDVEVLASPSEIAALVRDGFHFLPSVLPPERVEELRQAVDEVSAQEAIDQARMDAGERDALIAEHAGDEFFDPPPHNFSATGHMARRFLSKRPELVWMVELPQPLSIARAVLGPMVQVGGYQSRSIPAKTPGRVLPWHTHFRTVPRPRPAFFCYPHAIVAVYYLDDVNDDNGPLVVLPGTHDNEREMVPPDSRSFEGEVVLRPKAGDVVLMHGNLWHRVQQTTGEGDKRRVVTCVYAPSWLRIRAIDGSHLSHAVLDRIAQEGSPERSVLMGEFSWG